MNTNKLSPKGAHESSFGHNEKHLHSMTSVGDKKHGMAKKMKPYGETHHTKEFAKKRIERSFRNALEK